MNKISKQTKPISKWKWTRNSIRTLKTWAKGGHCVWNLKKCDILTFAEGGGGEGGTKTFIQNMSNS